MRFGIFNLMSLHDNPHGVAGVIRDTETMVQLADDIGFDVAWFAEHHFSNYSISASPLFLGARMSALTRNIRMGSGVIVLPLYHPLRLLQEIGLLENMTEGRMALGLGSGYMPYEFERYGKRVADKTELFLEHWEVLEQGLTTGYVEFEGKHVKVPATVIATKPSSMPQIFLTSSDPRVIKRLSTHGITLFATAGGAGTKKLYELAANLQTAWEAADLGSEQMPFALQQYVHVTDSTSEALEAAERARKVARAVGYLRNTQLEFEGVHLKPPIPVNEPSLETYRDNLIIGDPHHVAERMVAEIRRLNPVHYSCFFQFGDMPIARAQRSLSRFGSEVIPLIEKELGPIDAIGSKVREPAFATL